MTTKLFWLYPIDGSEWHSPEEVLARLTQVFDNVSVDRDKARILGQQFISSYRLLLDANLGVETSTPIDKVERQWSHALILQVSDVSQDTAPFQVFVRTEDKLELQFPPKTPFHRKRRSAEKVSKALGYTIEHFNPDY